MYNTNIKEEKNPLLSQYRLLRNFRIYLRNNNVSEYQIKKICSYLKNYDEDYILKFTRLTINSNIYAVTKDYELITAVITYSLRINLNISKYSIYSMINNFDKENLFVFLNILSKIECIAKDKELFHSGVNRLLNSNSFLKLDVNTQLEFIYLIATSKYPEIVSNWIVNEISHFQKPKDLMYGIENMDELVSYIDHYAEIDGVEDLPEMQTYMIMDSFKAHKTR